MRYKNKSQLNYREHFILRKFRKFTARYLMMWLVIILLAAILANMGFRQPVESVADVQMFARSFIMIAITTITIAIPTCLRTVFAAYEHYQSTTIKKIILNRFPVTLLTISAFTTLIISILITSGILGNTIAIQPAFIFYVALFWIIICIMYIFVAIEKLVYFTFNSPYAILEKLEYNILSINHITNHRKYTNFRRELASINDIATTILHYSTGRDDAIVAVLAIFDNIHEHYLSTADKKNEQQFSYHISACKAVEHEIVRMARSAYNSRNEQTITQILRLYCAMIADAMHIDTSIGHFQDMMTQLNRLQTYADDSGVLEIKITTYFDWFFMLAADVGNKKCSPEKYSLVSRTLATTLRKATIDDKKEMITEFFQTAANTNPEYNTSRLTNDWRIVLDRAIFVYTTWLIDTTPEKADEYLQLIGEYSDVNANLLIPILPMSKQRLQDLFTYEKLASFADTNDLTTSTIASSEQTVLAMRMNIKNTAAHTLVILYIMHALDFDLNDLKEITSDKHSNDIIKDIKQLRKATKRNKRLKTSQNLFPDVVEFVKKLTI